MSYSPSARDRQEMATLVGVVALVMVAAWHMHLTQKWVAGLTGTAAVFGLTLAAFRRSWRERWFWFSLSFIFFVHSGLVWVTLSVFLRNREAVNVPAVGSAILSESVLVIGFLAVRRGKRLKTRRMASSVKKNAAEEP